MFLDGFLAEKKLKNLTSHILSRLNSENKKRDVIA